MTKETDAGTKADVPTGTPGPSGGATGDVAGGDGPVERVTPDKDGDAGAQADRTVDPEVGASLLSNWVFVDEKSGGTGHPKPQEVVDLLTSLPAVWGVDTVDFIDYVQPLPQKVALKDDQGRKIPGEFRQEWRLYMSVAGRQKMLQTAAESNDWRVDFVPSDYITLDKSAPIYRETCVVYQHLDGGGQSILGSKSGTSKFGGGDYYVEKAETAARGRAIAAWGFGVLPGSGVASLDEMQAGPVAPDEPTTQSRQERQPPQSKGDLLQECLTNAEEIRQLRDDDEFEMRLKLADYVRGLGVEISKAQNEDGKITELDWSQVSPAQLRLLREQQRKTLAQIRPSKV